MKLKNLLLESEEAIKVKKEVSLSVKMKEFYGVITRYELEKKIHPDDKVKIETLKLFITDMLKQADRREES